MKNETLYFKTIDILVKAYFEETLFHGMCYACAVGNIVAGNCGLRVEKFEWLTKEGISVTQHWSDVFHAESTTKQTRMPENYRGIAKLQIDSTGYTWEELALIEMAFESKYDPHVIQEHNMFMGLMAVIEVLGQIHECDKETIEESKLMFVKC